MPPPLNPSKPMWGEKEKETAETGRSVRTKNRNRNQVKNSAQDEDFVVAEGKIWKENFS